MIVHLYHGYRIEDATTHYVAFIHKTECFRARTVRRLRELIDGS